VHKVEIDLMQPIDPERPPKVHKPTLNHIGTLYSFATSTRIGISALITTLTTIFRPGLWVDNLNNAVDELTNKEVQFTPGGIRKGAAGYDVAFIHPKSAAGVLVELVQAPDDVVTALS